MLIWRKLFSDNNKKNQYCVYNVPGTAQTLYIFQLIKSSQHYHLVIIIPILQIRKVRHKENNNLPKNRQLELPRFMRTQSGSDAYAKIMRHIWYFLLKMEKLKSD